MNDLIPTAHVHRLDGHSVVAPGRLSPAAESALEVIDFVIALWPLTITIIAAMVFLVCATKL